MLNRTVAENRGLQGSRAGGRFVDVRRSATVWSSRTFRVATSKVVATTGVSLRGNTIDPYATNEPQPQSVLVGGSKLLTVARVHCKRRDQ